MEGQAHEGQWSRGGQGGADRAVRPGVDIFDEAGNFDAVILDKAWISDLTQPSWTRQEDENRPSWTNQGPQRRPSWMRQGAQMRPSWTRQGAQGFQKRPVVQMKGLQPRHTTRQLPPPAEKTPRAESQERTPLEPPD